MTFKQIINNSENEATTNEYSRENISSMEMLNDCIRFHMNRLFVLCSKDNITNMVTSSIDGYRTLMSLRGEEYTDITKELNIDIEDTGITYNGKEVSELTISYNLIHMSKYDSHCNDAMQIINNALSSLDVLEYDKIDEMLKQNIEKLDYYVYIYREIEKYWRHKGFYYVLDGTINVNEAVGLIFNICKKLYIVSKNKHNIPDYTLIQKFRFKFNSPNYEITTHIEENMKNKIAYAVKLGTEWEYLDRIIDKH